MDSFVCHACGCNRPMAVLSDLGCSCLLCTPCAVSHVQQQLRASASQMRSQSSSQGLEAFTKGQTVWYRQRDGTRASAVVVDVDNSIQPPQYGIDLAGTIRFTEAQRLTAAHDSQPADASQLVKGAAVWYRQRDGSWVHAVIVQVDRSIQPPQYGVQLPQASEPRYTEQSRLALLLPGQNQSSAATAAPAVLKASCPVCAGQLSQQHLRRLVPEAVEQLLELQTDMWLQQHGIIRCPNPSCQALIERVPASPQDAPGSAANGNGAAAQHRHQHYYRCAMCSKDFCDECRSSPYHTGFTCQQHAAPQCLFCDQKVLEEVLQGAPGLPSRELRAELGVRGVDSSRCIERADLLELARFRSQCCGAAECLTSLNGSCLQLLPCGHHCCGRRGHGACMPCLVESCMDAEAPRGLYDCCFCLEPLAWSPVLQLTCGHVVHVSCARARLSAGWPGPELSFHFLFCPLCGSGSEGRCGNIQVMTSQPHLQDECLEPLLQPLLQLRSQVVSLAKKRLQLEGLTRSAPELQPGGTYDGRPADYALQKFLFFRCTRCRLPYFGGARACGAAAGGGGRQGAAAPFNVQELVCGGCSAGAGQRACQEHGDQYLEWKCQYCCSIAAWFCWGTTHMCDACHQWATRGEAAPTQRCPGRGRCPLQLPHPQPGQEHCLGCSLCRQSQQQL